VIAFGPILRARFYVIHTLDYIVHAVIRIHGSEPLFATTIKSLENVHPLKFGVGRHPRRVVSAIDASPRLYIRVVRVIENDWHVIEIGKVVFVRGPIVVPLDGIFIGTIGRAGKVSGATLLSVHKKVMFFISVYTHPGRVIPTKAAIAHRKIREKVVPHGVWVEHPWLIFSFRVDWAFSIRAV